jgi:hypothetical protein
VEATAKVGRVGAERRVDVRALVRQRRVLGELVVTVAAALPEVRRRAVRGDPVHPGRELGVPPEPLQAPVGPQVRILHHVARVLLVADEPEGERVRVCVRCPHQLVEGPLVTVACGDDQLGHFCWHRGVRPRT